jgi:DNA-binding transcriptional ArsR family regulator
MLKEKIGETAGTIWNILRERDEISISSLPRILNETPGTVNQSLGWLAREGKIEFREEGRKTLISLAESEK